MKLVLSTIVSAIGVTVVLMAISSTASAQSPVPALCGAMTTRTENFQGKTYTKYNIIEAAGIRCQQVQATRPAMPWKVFKTKWSQQD